MRVLLVTLNEELLPDPVFPLGLACLAGALHDAGHEYRAFDLNFGAPEELYALALSFVPDAIALSLRNVDNVAYPQSRSYLTEFRDICRGLTKAIDCPVILGGSGFSLYPERIMQELGADYGIVGSGEGPLISLLHALENAASQDAVFDVPNLFIRRDKSITFTREERMPLPAALPRRESLPLDRYLELGGMANVQTKRGCPLKCIYCSYPVIEGPRAMLRPVDEVVDELEALTRAGCRDVFFVDSVFNFPLENAKSICREIIDRKLELRWTCYAMPKLDAEAVELFVQSGCVGVEFGTDTLDDAMLRSMGKSFTHADAVEASSLCSKAELPFCHAILAGGPGETPQTLAATAERIAAMDPTAVIFMTGIRIIPNTELERIARQEGVIDGDTDMLEPVFYLSEAIKADLDTTIRRLAREHRTWIFPGHGIRCSPELARRIRRSGSRIPLWLHLDPNRR
ncbi:B12-binding domain-containing radical SAM protein [Oceanidesulfovibrio indonesiensis]|uniref:B12-binding domain-containing radical SAM protein n=1 Tax=Oceanidesulfovibrio indonesiensis TaxID=54767 RepID=A0A7M3MIJ9_9BACT|nr:lipid biosynthesis B12-binding/radical SAM protein [Oceanidesulfovibrio indonesiensis]TVM19220.1 B12-binding domain-containing radical SAM protein [Oceanidesulfovibrio indonesiensis]